MTIPSIDNETRQPSGPQPLTVYREETYTQPGETPETNRTVVCRFTGGLGPVTGHLGLTVGAKTEFFAKVGVPHTDKGGRQIGIVALDVPIPVRSLFDAFAKLDDAAWLSSAVQFAVSDYNRRAAIASVRGGR